MNLTLSVDERIVEKAREVARQQGTSLNALIRQYLESVAGEPSAEEVASAFERLWAESSGDSGGWKFDREEIYAERLDRSGRK